MEPLKDQTTRERRRQRTKAMILQSAEDLLAEGGLQKLTLADIAHRAAYSKPAIYEYFEGIEDILQELSSAGFIRLGEIVQAVPRDLPPDERMVQIGYANLQFASENPELFKLMFTRELSVSRPSEEIREMQKRTQVAYLEVAGTIQECIAKGIFKTRQGLDWRAMLYMFWTMVHGMASLKHSLMKELEFDVESYRTQAFSFLVNSLKGNNENQT
jgi:AcrR family transcriptional regulator